MSVSTQSNSGLIAANLNAVMREDSLSSIISLLQMSKYIVNGTPSADPARVLPPNSGRLPCSAPLAWPAPWSRGGQEFSGTYASQLQRNHVRPPRDDLRGQQSGSIRLVRPHALSTGRTVDISVPENPDSAHS